MKHWQKCVLIALLMALFLSLPAPGLAWNGDDPSPLPGWLQWLLQWVGLTPPPAPPTPGPAPVFTPTPAVTEYRVGSLQELEGLPARLQPGKRVRLYLTSADIAAMTSAYLVTPKAQSNGLREGKVTLLDGALKVEGKVARSAIEEQGIPLPWGGDLIQVAGEGSLTVADCRPVVNLKSAQANGIPFPAISLLNQLANEALSKEWPSEICIESLKITPQEVIAEGYRR